MFMRWWRQVTESPYQYALSRRASGRLLSILFAGSGLFTLASLLSPGVTGEKMLQIGVIGGVGVVCGLLGWWIPWQRLPRGLMVVIPIPMADALIAFHNHDVHDPYSYGVYFTIVYVWIGLTQRQGVGFLLLPITAAAYLLPMVMNHGHFADCVSAVYMLPVFVLIGETLAGTSHRLAEAQTRLEHLAYHDSLTGLYNRAHFHQVLGRLVVEWTNEEAGGGERLALIMLIDLNDFKSVNDQFGHGTGDQLLQEAARLLEESTHGHAVWARLGGDEFGCIVPHLGIGLGAADRLVNLVRGALQTPIQVEHRMFRVGLSIGIAVMPLHGTTAKDVMAHADRAVYADKSAPHAVGTHCLPVNG